MFLINIAGGFPRDNRGVTLVEVMMAVAVFGIIIVFIIRMTGMGSKLTSENMDQVMMMELARAEMEGLKAVYREDPDSLPPPGVYHDVLAYPPGTTVEEAIQNYAITYHIENYNGIMLRIIVSPLSDVHSDPDNPDGYMLVAWLPE